MPCAQDDYVGLVSLRRMKNFGSDLAGFHLKFQSALLPGVAWEQLVKFSDYVPLGYGRRFCRARLREHMH